jgi:hypothetical protein
MKRWAVRPTAELKQMRACWLLDPRMWRFNPILDMISAAEADLRRQLAFFPHPMTTVIRILIIRHVSDGYEEGSDVGE